MRETDLYSRSIGLTEPWFVDAVELNTRKAGWHPHRAGPWSSLVSSGFPLPAEDDIDQHLEQIEHLLSNPTATFFVIVIVTGESMAVVTIINRVICWWWTEPWKPSAAE